MSLRERTPRPGEASSLPPFEPGSANLHGDCGEGEPFSARGNLDGGGLRNAASETILVSGVGGGPTIKKCCLVSGLTLVSHPK